MKQLAIKTLTGRTVNLTVQDDEIALETDYYSLPWKVRDKIDLYSGRVLIPVSTNCFVFVASKSILIEIGGCCRTYQQ